MIYLDLEQRSPEWFALRCGKVTASRISDMMATTRNGWAATRARYLEEIVAERLTGETVIKRVPSMEARSEMEPDARDAYEFYSDNEPQVVGFVTHPTIEMAGASPDSLIGEDGGLEIKCLDSKNHIELLKSGIIDNGYLLQCQFNIACAERDWWDFMSYDPRMKEERLRVFIKRINRDDHCIAKIESAVVDFLAEVEATVAQLQNGHH